MPQVRFRSTVDGPTTTTTADPLATTTTADPLATTTTADPAATTTTGEPGPAPGGYTVDGATSGEVRNVPLGLEANAVATRFTITLVPPYGTAVISGQDTDTGSTFSPATLTLSDGTRTGYIDYSPGSAGTRSIVFTNNRGLPNVTKSFTALPQAGKTVLGSINDPTWAAYRKLPDLGGYTFFGGSYDVAKPLSFINKRIDGANGTVDPRSAELMGYYSANLPNNRLVFDEGANGVPHYGAALNVIRGTVQLVNLNVGYYINDTDPADRGPYRIDPLASAYSYYKVPVDSRRWMGDEIWPPADFTDQHVIVLDPDNDMLYELFRGWTPDGGVTWECDGCGSTNLATGALRKDGCISGDGAGLPIFPMLIRYDEVARGVIPHAVRFTTSNGAQTNTAQWPARHGMAWFNPIGLPAGARVRLKTSRYNEVMALWSAPYPPGYDAEWFEHAKVMLTCLHDYGMILADGGIVFEAGCHMDERWHPQTFSLFAVNSGYQRAVNLMPGTDFEVLEIIPGCSFTGPSTGQVGVPIVFDLARIPIDDLNYANTLYLTIDAVVLEPGFLTLTPASPTGQLTWTPSQAGVFTVSLYQTGTYWVYPPPLTVTVT